MSEQSSLTPSAQPDIADMDWALDYGQDSAPEAEAVATPLPSDAPASDESAGTVEQQQSKVESPAVERKEEAAPAKEEEKVKPEADKSASSSTEGQEDVKGNTFWTHFLDSTKPAEEVRAHLEKRSAARYGELEQAVINKRLSDPLAFASSYYQRDPEGYGKLALTVYQAAPDYFAKAIVGEEAKPEDVQTAYSFWKTNKDLTPSNPFTKEQIEDFIEVYPEYKEQFERLAKGEPPKAAEQAKTPEQPKQEAKEESAKETPAQPDPLAEQKREVFHAAEEAVDNYVVSKTAEKYGYAATPEERELHPEIADLKDDAADVLFQGRKNVLPAFYPGFLEWSKQLPEADKAKFTQAVERILYFSDKREKENALEATQALLPFADRYLEERKRHPFFTRADARIQAAIQAANPTEEAETIIPGRTGSQTKSSDAMEDFTRELIRDAINSGR